VDFILTSLQNTISDGSSTVPSWQTSRFNNFYIAKTI